MKIITWIHFKQHSVRLLNHEVLEIRFPVSVALASVSSTVLVGDHPAVHWLANPKAVFRCGGAWCITMVTVSSRTCLWTVGLAHARHWHGPATPSIGVSGSPVL